MTSSNSDDVVYTARLEVRVRDLEQLLAQQGDEITELVRIVGELSSSRTLDDQLVELRDRHEQLAARFRILEQSAGE